MNNEKAIEILKSITVRDTGEKYNDNEGHARAQEIGEALEMAIKALSNPPKGFVCSISLSEDQINDIVAMGVLKAQEAQANRWIPVTERLPDERGVYIVTEKVFKLDDREHKGRYNTMVELVEYCNGKWQRASFFEVIAWKPLPKPCESEDK